MDEFTLPEGIRALLPAVGESLVLAISPDKADGLSEQELEVFRRLGPQFFGLLEGKALPDRFSTHFEREVLRDIAIIRDDPKVREDVRKELLRLLLDRERMSKLYTSGGETFSDILYRGAGKSEKGMFREGGSYIGRVRRAKEGGNA